MEVIIRPDTASAAEFTARLIADAINEKPDFVLGLATGGTMEPVYADLARMNREGKVDFSLVRTFNLDEYIGLPPENPQSYRYYMNYHLFDKVNIDKRNTHLPDGMAKDEAAEGERYEEAIRLAGGIDLQLLGSCSASAATGTSASTSRCRVSRRSPGRNRSPRRRGSRIRSISIRPNRCRCAPSRWGSAPFWRAAGS